MRTIPGTAAVAAGLLAAVTVVAAGTSVLVRLTSGPVARRTAPAAVPPARALPGGDVRVGDGGSDRRHDIPVGYRHTSLGAAQAATNLLVGYLGTPMFDATRRGDVLAAIAAPEDRRALAAAWDPHLPAGPAALADVNLYQLDPQQGGWRLDTWSAAGAEVTIWTPLNYTLVRDHGLHHTRWLLERVRLAWVGGDWKLAAVTDLPDPPDPHTGWGTPADPVTAAALLAAAGQPGMRRYASAG
jgi:hypothetical protein